MDRKIVSLIGGLFATVCLQAEDSVCNLFKDLKGSDGRQLTITGELLISKDLAVLGSADCDNRYSSPIEEPGIRVDQVWPTAILLRAAPDVPSAQIKLFSEAAARADRLRGGGKTVSASGSFTGRLRVLQEDGLPAQLTFSSVENLTVAVLPDPNELPVIPICELFENLTAWKGKRIAVRGEVFSGSEASGIAGRCKTAFETDGYRWPVALNYGVPAYYSRRTELFSPVDTPSKPPAGSELLRGRNSVVKTATYVGLLRMRSHYDVGCGEDGRYSGNGFGHLNYAPAELIVEAVRDVELSRRPPAGDDDADERRSCLPPNLATLCAGADTLRRATSLGCVEKVTEILAKEGIDSIDGGESAALRAAISRGDATIVRLLIDRGAPVNPVKMRLRGPLEQAATQRKIGIMKILLQAGANVEARDKQGIPYLPNHGFFSARVAKILLEAGANPNARDRQGRTALMNASAFGFEDVVELFIKHRADVNLRDNSGRSSLMHAAAGGYVDAIPHLLANGADPHARDLTGDTALDIARKSKNQVAIELLAQAMNAQ